MIKGIGIDLVDVQRFQKIKHKQEFLKQVFTTTEIKRQKSRPKHDFLSSCLFALKEAILKALRIGLHTGSYWHNINIMKTEKLSVILSGYLGGLLDRSMRVSGAYSCSKRYAVGIILIYK
jgi:phosphopantetheine--protein transferase-like protein